MPMTVPEFAHKVDRSSQAIQQRMRKIPNFVEKYTSKPHRSRIISDKGVEILLNHKAINSKGHAERAQRERENALIDQLREDLANARSDKSKLYQQLKNSSDQVKTMTLTSTELQKQYQNTQTELQNERLKVQKAKYRIKLLKFKVTTNHDNLVEYKKAHPVTANNSTNKPSGNDNQSNTSNDKQSNHPQKHNWFINKLLKIFDN